MPLKTGDNLDDLLGGDEEPKQEPIDELDALLQDDIPATSSKKRAPSTPKEGAPKTERVPRAPAKGVWVQFKNQQGQLITGIGSPYMVVRFNNKLHYKQEDACHVMTPEEIEQWLLTQ